MKNLLILALVCGAIVSCSKDDGRKTMLAGIDDPVFNKYCRQFDTDHDGVLSPAEAAAVTRIGVGNSYGYKGRKIRSLAGIGQFPNLTELYCSYNDISELDVSGNTALTVLYCSYNNLSGLNVKENTALIRLNCSYNNISELDVSQNAYLTYLYCNGNDLEELDTGNNHLLGSLNCQYNEISTLDISGNIAMYRLDCFNNFLPADALRDVFTALPQRDTADHATIYCNGNHGWTQLSDADKQVAMNKNWTFKIY